MKKIKLIKKDKNNKLTFSDYQKVKSSDSQLKVLFIDTNLGIDHVMRFAEDNHIIYLYQAEVSAYPKLEDTICGFGMHKNLYLVEDLAKVIQEVDLVIILDNIFPYLTDYLKSKNKPVFGPSPLLVELELNKTRAYFTLKELGISVPEGEVIVGIENLINFIKDKEDGKTKFFIKINKIRGNIETFYVKYHTEIIPFLSQSKIGPFMSDLEFLVQFEENGIEIGCDMIVSPENLVLPFSYTIEEKGSGNVATWRYHNGFIDRFYKKLINLIQEDDYRCFLCVEGFWDGKEFKVIDITSRFPYPVSSLYPRFIENYCEVIYKVANNEKIEAKVDEKNPYMMELTGYTIETNIWRPIHIDKNLVNFKGEGIGFRKVIFKDNLYWFVPGDAVVFTLNAKGKNLDEAYQKIEQIVNNLSVYSSELNLGFYHSVKEKIEKLNTLGKEFEF